MSITLPLGFRAAGVAAGLRSAPGRPDLALVVNDGPSQVAAAVFTSNRIKAAPVLWSQQAVADGELHAVILNAGGANACTGPKGFSDTHRTAEHVAALLDCGAAEIAVCSTGLIGEPLAIDALLEGASRAHMALADDGGESAANAILTTDTHAKQAHVTRGGVTVAGMAKGAGMLAPGLATMLCVITTDAVIDSSVAEKSLRQAVSLTFDRLDTDGCMSTNDTVVLMSSGASAVAVDQPFFDDMLAELCDDLAHQLLRDAEGASKWIAVRTVNAASEADAITVGRAVARSNLFKCAVHGGDPNWGRVLAAVGTTEAAYQPDQISVSINGIRVCRDGAAAESRDRVDMSGPEVDVVIDLAAGDCEATIRTTDLTAAYVHENSAYST